MTNNDPAAIVASIPNEASRAAISIVLRVAEIRDKNEALKEARKTARAALQMTDAWQAAKEIKDRIKAETKEAREEAAAYLREARQDAEYVTAAHAAEVLGEQVRTLTGLVAADVAGARQMLMPFAREVGA